MKDNLDVWNRRSFLKKSALAAGSLASMSALVSACGDSTTTTTGGGQVTLSYTDWFTKNEESPMLADFMTKYPNIKVKENILPGGTYDQVLKPRMIGGDAPDVMHLMSGQYAAFVQQNWLVDVTNEPGTQLMQGLPGLADQYKINGKIYGTTLNGGYADDPVYYNKKYFDQNGLKVPTTVDEFLALCETIKGKGIDPMVVGGKDPWTTGILMGGYTNAGNKAKFGPDTNLNLKLAKGELTVKDLYTDPINFYATLVKKGYIGKASGTLTYDQSVQYFVDGKAAMIAQGTWLPSVDAVKQADPSSFEMASFVFPYPQYNGKVYLDSYAGDFLGVSATSKHPKEALVLYNYILQKDTMQKYIARAGFYTIIPGLNPAQFPPALNGYEQPHADEAHYHVGLPAPSKTNVAFPQGWNDASGNVYVDLLAGASASDEIQKLMDTFNKIKGQIIITNQ